MSKDREDKAESSIALEPDKISCRHRALMRKLVSGMTLSQACDDLGFSISRASIIVNSPLFQAELASMEEELKRSFIEARTEKEVAGSDPVHTLLSETAELAARTLKGALSDDSATTRISAARDILDRAGYAKEDKIKARVLVEPSPSLVAVIGRIVADRSVETRKGGGDAEPIPVPD